MYCRYQRQTPSAASVAFCDSGAIYTYQNLLLKYVQKKKMVPAAVCTKTLVNPFKPSGVKWLHYKVFKAILHGLTPHF